MWLIPIRYSMKQFEGHLVYTLTTTGVDPLTRDLAPLYEAELARWEILQKKERESTRALIKAEAEVGLRDVLLDGVTMPFGGQLFVMANRDTESVFFKTFLPTAAYRFVRRDLRTQSEHTRDVIVPGLAKLDAQHPLRTQYEVALAEAAQAALVSLDQRAKMRAARTLVKIEVDEWKEGVNRLRTTTYAELLRRSAEHNRTRSWARSFFPAAHHASSPEEQETESPAPTQALA